MDIQVVGRPVSIRQSKVAPKISKAEQLKQAKEESCQASARAAAERIRSRKRQEREVQASTQAAAAAAKRKVVDHELEKARKADRVRAEIYALNRLLRAVDAARGRAAQAGSSTMFGQV